jgi:N-acetylated-alpha-linked acidic dipeptidase
MTRLPAVLIAGLMGLATFQGGSDPAPFGFTSRSTETQRAVEERYLALPDPSRLEAFHRFLTEEPHVAGSRRDRELAEWTRDRWREFGLEDVAITEHEVLLPYPEEVTIEMTAPRPWRASMREDPIDGDKDTSADTGIPYHAYSASGDVTAPVVYAASGNPADYDWLAARGIDIKGRIALVRYSVPYSYRGFKALTAQQRGAAGILIYSDPADDGYGKGAVYPKGPWGPESHIQRGGIVYDFMVPGDPLTPGWASVAGAKRIAARDTVSLPAIMSAPLSYKDARPILEALGGPTAPKAWQGGLPIPYRVGPGPATVRMRLRMDDRVRPIWTVTGRIRGAVRPDETVIVGNHRDAWIYGGVDPSSGSAALMELARGLGTLAREGRRPARTIELASWDAEEFTLTSSTEWGEQHEARLASRAIAYINVDSAASGPNFSAAAVPSLNRLIEEAAGAIRDPRTRTSILAAARARRTAERGTLPTGGSDSVINNRLGSGSDYTVFLNFIGVPIADLSFDGPYGVYHSMYDNHQWVSRIGDPGFRYHAAMAKLMGVLALRLANADVVPLDYRPYARAVEMFLGEVEKRWASRPGERRPLGAGADPFGSVRAAVVRFGAAAQAVAVRAERLTRGSVVDPAERDRVNRALIAAERALLDPEGIPGRPWYRHQVYAPKPTYAPEVLPALAEAIDAGDAARLATAANRLAAALDRAARVLAP